MEMLILRRKGGKLGAQHAGSASSVPSMEVLVQELPASQLQHLKDDANVVAAAPTMPLALIRPVSVASGDPKSPKKRGKVAWGIKAVRASTSPFTGKGVTVAVLDTGIQKDHPAFAGATIIGRNFTAGPVDDFTDVDGHGTHCAGTIFGRDVEGTRIGIAPGVTRCIIGKVLGAGGGSTATLYTAMNWAIEQGADIISMSLGIDMIGFRDQLEAVGIHPKQATSTAMSALIDNVRFFDKFGSLLRSGVGLNRCALVVAATGNESDRFGTPSFVLGASYPSATEDFVSVGAVEQTGNASLPLRMATFSNSGATFVGPGVDIVSADLGGGLRSLSGTSMATPHVSGVATLWAEKLMLAGKAEKLLERLKLSAQIPAGLDEADVGYGVPHAPRP